MANARRSFFQSATASLTRAYRFCTRDVWNDENEGRVSNIVKVANLAVRNFFNHEVQERACALTYRTVLALVPALAMLFAIARGFGFQNLVHGQLMTYFPAQREALESALTFVDSYLAHASEGLFVGIGLVALFYTNISLISSVETTFNKIWGVAHNRSLYRRVTDYTAMLVFIPVLMVCSGGLSIFMSSTVQDALPVEFSPVVSLLLDCLPIVLEWLMFAFAFWLLPNAKVQFRYALLSAVVFGTIFLLVQWIFMQGQIMVSSYNAIYGSFAFVPLFLLWLQISWTLILLGAVSTYSMQNIFGFHYSHHHDVSHISPAYFEELSIMALALIVKRFSEQQPPLTKGDLAGKQYKIPIVLVNSIFSHLYKAGLISKATTESGDGYQPAFAIEKMTIKEVKHRLRSCGSNRFLAVADQQFAPAYSTLANASDSMLVAELIK